MFVAVLVFVPTSSAFAQIEVASQITDLKAVVDDKTVTLTWTAPNLNGGTFEKYDIFYYDGDEGDVVFDHSTTSETLTFPNTVPPTYSIRTTTSAGISVVSDTITATQLVRQLPSRITDLSATAGVGTITLSWTVPDLNGGTFRNYDILYGDVIETVSDYSTNSKTITVSENVPYTFTIRTSTSAGIGLSSNTVTATPLASPVTSIGASQITDLSATAGDESVTLTWTTPNLTQEFFRYEITYGGETVNVTPYSTTSTTISNLNNGEEYTFTIVSRTSAGLSLQSNEATATPYLSYSITTDDGYVVSFYESESKYHVSIDGANNDTLENLAINHRTTMSVVQDGNTAYTNDYDRPTRSYSVPVTNCTLETLDPATDCTLELLSPDKSYVISRNGYIDFDPTKPFTVHYDMTPVSNDFQNVASVVTFPTPTLPSQITDLAATARDGAVELTWTASNLNGGTFAHYTITYGGETVRIIPHSTTSTTISNLNNGEEYTFTIITHRSAGSSLPSNAVTVTLPVPVTPIANPSTILDLRAVAGVGEIALTWTAPNLNGGTFVSYYIYDSGGDIIETISDHSTTSKTFAFPNVAPQSFSIRTETSSGLGSRSNTVTATPLAPTVTPFTQTGNGTIATVSIVSPPTTPNFTFTFERIGLNSSLDLSTRGIVDDTDTFEDLTILICNISSPVNTISGLSASGINTLEESNCREVTDKNTLVFNLFATDGIPKTVAYIVTDSNDLSSKGNITFAIADEANNPPTAPDISFRLEAGVDHVIDFIAAGVTDDNTEVSDLVITLTDFEREFDIYVEFLSGINEMSYVVTDENKQVTIGTTSSALSGFRSQDVMYSVTDSQGLSSTGTISFDITKAKPVLLGAIFTETLPYGLDSHTIAVNPGDFIIVSPATYRTSLTIGLNTTSTTTEGGTIELVYGEGTRDRRPPFTVSPGSIEGIVYTPPQQNFVGTDQITLKGSVTADGVTISAESTLNFVVLAPQCSSQVGDSIAFGDQTVGETSDEQRLDISNTGDISSNIFLKGTDWIDGTDRSVMDIGQTRYSGTESSDFTSKTQLSNSNVSFDDNLESGTVGTAYLQLLLDLLVTGFTGEATQTITVVTSCDL